MKYATLEDLGSATGSSPEVSLPEKLNKEGTTQLSSRNDAASEGSSFPMRNSPQMLSAPTKGGKRPKKVFIKPGHSQLDWMKLSSSGADLRGVKEPSLLTLDEVAKHNAKNDCWIVINNKVFNITHYMDFHPGGRAQLMRAAGKDGSALFYNTHAWVNVDAMLDKCLVGFLRPEQR
ncbi:hypothetical protein H4R24_004061 [Coemansia sp. RSA 988]|nr:hypothetical protein H4R24_004061 [Coemansia sp. RSA 988]